MLLPLFLALGALPRLPATASPRCPATCTCSAPRPTAEDVRSAIIVLEGTAGAQRPYGLPNRGGSSTVTRILVGEVWKGAVRDTIFVFTGSGGGDCGFSFTAGTQYLLFLTQDADGRLVTTICSGSAPLSEATSRLAELGAAPARRRP